MNKTFDISMIRFAIVGIGNTIFSAVIMFLLYNLAHYGYWGSSIVSYILSSILSYILNKNYTFQNKGATLETIIKFIITISLCYIIAFSLAKPAVIMLLAKLFLSKNFIDQVAMVIGMCIFTILNYIGQRHFAFKN